MSAQQNLQRVQAIYQAFGSGDIPGLVERLSPDIEWTWHGPATIPWAGTFRGRDEVLGFFGKVGGNAEILEFEPHTMLPGDDHVLVIGREKVRARTTGRVFEVAYAHTFRLRDGRVYRIEEFTDSAAVAAAFAAA